MTAQQMWDKLEIDELRDLLPRFLAHEIALSSLHWLRPLPLNLQPPQVRGAFVESYEDAFPAGQEA